MGSFLVILFISLAGLGLTYAEQQPSSFFQLNVLSVLLTHRKLYMIDSSAAARMRLILGSMGMSPTLRHLGLQAGPVQDNHNLQNPRPSLSHIVAVYHASLRLDQLRLLATIARPYSLSALSRLRSEQARHGQIRPLPRAQAKAQARPRVHRGSLI